MDRNISFAERNDYLKELPCDMNVEKDVHSTLSSLRGKRLKHRCK